MAENKVDTKEILKGINKIYLAKENLGPQIWGMIITCKNAHGGHNVHHLILPKTYNDKTLKRQACKKRIELCWPK